MSFRDLDAHRALPYAEASMADHALVRRLDYKEVMTIVLNVGANGEITIPEGLRDELALAPGGKVAAVRMGQVLVLAPYDEELESLGMGLRNAMKDAGISVQELEDRALVERAGIVRERYRSSAASHRKRKRSK